MTRLDFNLKNLPADIGAAVTMALVAVPDAIASAILAGVNPTYGFHALIVGTPIGSLFTSSQFMNIGSTAAMMLAVGGVLVDYSGDQPDDFQSGWPIPGCFRRFPGAGSSKHRLWVVQRSAVGRLTRRYKHHAQRRGQATLVLDIQDAVFLGIVLSILDYVYISAQDVQVVELVEKNEGVFVERPRPEKPGDNSITILFAWGALFFASVRTIEDLLSKRIRHRERW